MRLIDADVLYAKFLDGKADTAAEKEMNQVCRYLILHEPTIDAVPVVRCGECVFKQRTGRCVKTGVYVNDDDFCSYGEKDGTK